jgi:hypothetical protein
VAVPFAELPDDFADDDFADDDFADDDFADDDFAPEDFVPEDFVADEDFAPDVDFDFVFDDVVDVVRFDRDDDVFLSPIGSLSPTALIAPPATSPTVPTILPAVLPTLSTTLGAIGPWPSMRVPNRWATNRPICIERAQLRVAPHRRPSDRRACTRGRSGADRRHRRRGSR